MKTSYSSLNRDESGFYNYITKLIDLLENIIAELNFPKVPIIIEIPKQKEHGDFSSNIAMQLAGKTEKKPLEIANDIIKKLTINCFKKKIDSY